MARVSLKSITYIDEARRIAAIMMKGGARDAKLNNQAARTEN